MAKALRINNPEVAAARQEPTKSPCPFCGAGGDNIEVEGCNSDHWVKCNACGSQGPFESGAHPRLAIALWNARAQIRALAPPDARASGASAQESKDFPP